MQLLRQHFSCWNQSKQIEEDEKNANLIFRTKLDVRFRFRFVSTSTRRVSGKNCQSDFSTNSLISFPLSDECCNVSILSNQWKSKSQCLSTPATHCHCVCACVCVCAVFNVIVANRHWVWFGEIIFKHDKHSGLQMWTQKLGKFRYLENVFSVQTG